MCICIYIYIYIYTQHIGRGAGHRAPRQLVSRINIGLTRKLWGWAWFARCHRVHRLNPLTLAVTREGATTWRCWGSTREELTAFVDDVFFHFFSDARGSNHPTLGLGLTRKSKHGRVLYSRCFAVNNGSLPQTRPSLTRTRFWRSFFCQWRERERPPDAAGLDEGKKNRLCLWFMYMCISHIIQLTPQKLSAEPRNSASAEALAGARRPMEHRGRRPGRRRFPEVLLPERSSRKE